jgi:hypothetical protein
METISKQELERRKKLKYIPGKLFKIIKEHGADCEYCQYRKKVIIEKAIELGLYYNED